MATEGRVLTGNLLEEVESRDRLGGRQDPSAYVIPDAVKALYDWSKGRMRVEYL